jgi:TolB-like protein
MAEKPTVFISYASQDAAVANDVVGLLERAGLACWIAPRDVVPGALYADEIVRAINESSLVVLVLSAQSVVSPHVGKELERASSKRRRIIALRTDDAALPRAFEYFLSESQWIEVGTGGFEPAAGKLAEAVRRHLGSSLVFSDDDSRTVAVSGTNITGDSRTGCVPAIAVLPFANMSGDPEQEYFSDGISEDIITDLSKVSALTVISRNSAFALKGRYVDLPEVARKLNVTHVLEGSVRKVGGRVRITAQLIDGASNAHLWAERYDRDLEDIFALQDEISQAIVKALKLRLLPDEKELIAERGTANVEAYDLFLRARALHSTVSGPEVRRSLDLYRKAVALDPDFAQAWAGLGSAITIASIYYSDLRAKARAEMDQAISHASELAPDLPAVRSGQIVQCLMLRDWARAEEHLIASLNKQAGTVIGLIDTQSMLLLVLGRANEAVKRTLLNRQADPLSLGLSFHLQFFLGCAGRLKEAEAEYERSKDLPGARGNIEWRGITHAMALKDHALVRQRFAAAFGEDVTFMPFAPDLLKVIDQPDDALAIVRAAFEHPACQYAGSMGAIAHWAVYYGDEDFAVKALRRGFVELYGPTVADIWSPVFAGPRRDPRFKNILRDIGLYDHWRRTGKWGDFARPVGDDDFDLFA